MSGLGLFLTLILALFGRAAPQDVFSEEVLVSWLTHHHIMVHLRFDQATTASRHHTSFPHAIQHLATTLPLDAVDLVLTSGRWHYGEWGTPMVSVNPVGAVLDATFRAGLDQAQLAGHWSALVHALSGLSCASLSLLRHTTGVAGGRLRVQDLAQPPGGFVEAAAAGLGRGEAAANASLASRGQRLHAMLPHEALCTENLTPWLRLLPCRDQAGLASLLRHRPTVFGAEYVSLGLSLDRGASPGGPQRGVRLVLSCTLVLRLPAPRPRGQKPQKTQPGKQPRGEGQEQRPPGLDLEQLLGARVEHFCPPALRSNVYVAVRPREAAPPGAADDGGCGGGGYCPWLDGGGGVAKESCTADEAKKISDIVEGSGANGRNSDDGDGGGGAGKAGHAAQRGVLLAAVDLGTTGRPAGTVELAARSRAMAYLRVYDTLDLLDVLGWGLHLSLPPLPSPLPPTQQQQQQQGRSSPSAMPQGSDGGEPGEEGALAAPGPADLTTERYVTGAGLLRGGMVLWVRRSPQLRERLAAGQGACVAGAGAGAATPAEAEADVAPRGGGPGPGGAGRAVCLMHVVCVYQVLPWYVRPWLHTLELLYDGQVVPLLPHLVARRVQPALQRSSPGVLDLCLHVPPAVAALQLRLGFSKAFLTAFEYPPDAHRGFDVPAAVVSYVDPLHARPVQWRAVRAGGGGGGVGESGGGGGGAGGGGEEEAVSSPLLVALAGGAVRQVYTAGLLVPLAAPDFSMPYNVICLSSTLLAVYFGAVVNLLTRRGGGADGGSGGGGGGKERGRGAARRKAVQVVALAVLFGGLALYLDADLREQAEGLLAALGLPLRRREPVCGGSQPC